jgi:hypothetical protein
MLKNINESFTGKFDFENDLYAFIDESGDEGFDFSKQCTKWFITSAIVMTPAESNEMLATLELFQTKYCQNSRIDKISFKDLKHNHRKNILGMLKKHLYLSTNSVFYKPRIDPDDRICTFPSMYFIGIKNLVERLSWLCNQYEKQRVHILISNRSNVDKDKLRKYLFETSFSAGKNMTYKSKLGVVSVSTPSNHPKLILADYSASTIFHALEKTSEAEVTEPLYFDIYLKGKMYSTNYEKYKGVWRNGLKCTPDDKSLIEYSGILEEGSGKL